MNHLGTKTIETNRLILRKFSVNDGKNMYKNWAGSDDVTRFLTWPTHTDSGVSEYVCKLWEEESKSKEKYQWCIEFKSINEAIGSIAAVKINEEINSVEIGYCIGKEFWNKGILTEAFNAIIEYFFNEVNVNRICARHDTNNPASGKVMAKCGLKFEGINRKADKNNSGICDAAVYGITKEEYEDNTNTNIIISDICTNNRELVNKFIILNWNSINMVVRGKVYDMSLLDGFVAYKNEEIIGLVTYIISDNECEIMSLDSLIENKGIGTKLLNEVLKLAKSKKCTKLKLITTNDNINAIRFYQKYGFDMKSIYKNALEVSRKLKPSIPVIGDCGIEIKHEIEFEMNI